MLQFCLQGHDTAAVSLLSKLPLYGKQVRYVFYSIKGYRAKRVSGTSSAAPGATEQNGGWNSSPALCLSLSPSLSFSPSPSLSFSLSPYLSVCRYRLELLKNVLRGIYMRASTHFRRKHRPLRIGLWSSGGRLIDTRRHPPIRGVCQTKRR